VGVVLSVFLLLISVTGFLLANKSRVAWLRPPEVDAAKVSSPEQIRPISEVVAAAFAVGLPELKKMGDIDRVDYRPKSNVFKVVSKAGYHEVQVDGATGKVLSVAKRNDQWIEDLHDLSFFSDSAHAWILPVVGLGLGALALSGIGLFFTPVVRRWRFKRKLPKRP
jgi:uncharacterized iron-regulated membrane protein